MIYVNNMGQVLFIHKMQQGFLYGLRTLKGQFIMFGTNFYRYVVIISLKMKIIMKKITLSALFLASILTFSACNSSENKDSKDVAEEQNDQKFDDTKLEDDSEFVVAAADGGMFEVELGKLAEKNAVSKSVKDFASMMVKDHGKAGDELKALAAQKNITIPAALSEDKQKKYNDLAEKKGADFDKAYVSLMVDDHKEDIKEFEDASKDAVDAEVKAWAAGKLPTLNEHLAKVQNLKDKMK